MRERASQAPKRARARAGETTRPWTQDRQCRRSQAGCPISESSCHIVQRAAESDSQHRDGFALACAPPDVFAPIALTALSIRPVAPFALVVDCRRGRAMGPVHLYLGAWVAGGLLLGASLLLDGRETPSEPPVPNADDSVGADQTAPRAVEEGAPALSPGARIFRLCSLALIGFGLCGLTAKGLDIDLWPWTLLCAVMAGVLLFALGYRLSRSQARSSI